MSWTQPRPAAMSVSALTERGFLFSGLGYIRPNLTDEEQQASRPFVTICRLYQEAAARPLRTLRVFTPPHRVVLTITTVIDQATGLAFPVILDAVLRPGALAFHRLTLTGFFEAERDARRSRTHRSMVVTASSKLPQTTRLRSPPSPTVTLQRPSTRSVTRIVYVVLMPHR